MAVLGRLLVSSAERLDLPDLLSLDSYAAGDWKYFLKSLVGDSKPYILKGFDVIDPLNAIGTQSCSIRVADSITYYPGSNSGAFYHGLAEGNTQAVPLVPELRKNAVNYVYLTFTTFNTSVDTRAFWDPDKDGGVGGEFTQDVNTESVIQVQVNVSTGSFPVNTIPVAKITVGPVVITAIEDARDLMFRLGSGGLAPNPFNNYNWRSLPGAPYQRTEPATQMLAGGVNPFQGADKNILTLKEWMDAVMSKLRELGGTTYWYDDASSFGLVTNFFDAVGTTFKSKGKWIHDTITPGLLTWSEDVQIKMTADPRTYIVRQGSNLLLNEEVMYVAMVRNQVLSPTDEAVTWSAGANYINTVGGAVGLFANLAKGDYVKKINDSFDKWLRVEEFYADISLGGAVAINTTAKSIRLSGVYLGTSGVEKGRYDKGEYLAIDAVVSSRDNATIANTGGNFHWLAMRSDTIEKTSNLVSHTLALAISDHDGATAKVTSVAHGLVDGDRVIISGTTNFNGTFEVEVETVDIFYITISGGTFADESGTAYFATVTTAARSTVYGFQEESANHGFNSDDTIIVAATTNYNGSYLINVTGPTTFTIPISAAFATETSGTATLARLIVRSEGTGVGLIQGQVIDIGGSIADNIRQYIGMASLSETAPLYAIAPGYNTLDGMPNWNCTVNENLTARVSKLTAMMADKAQDKTIKYLPSGYESVTNTTVGPNQDIVFNASVPPGRLDIAMPGSDYSYGTVILSGTLSLAVDQAAYITIDRNTTFSLASLAAVSVADIVDVPVDENTIVLAVRLGTTEVWLWDGFYVSAGAPAIVPGYATFLINQDRNLKLVRGGTWSLGAGTNLQWSSNANIQIPGLAESVNVIPAGNITLAVDGDVAYVEINRIAPGGSLTVNTSSISALVSTTDTVVIARRTGTAVIVGTHSFLLQQGESKELDAGASNETLSALGLTSEVDKGMLRILSQIGGVSKRVIIAPIDSVVSDGTTWGNEIAGLRMKFDGTQIDLETGNYYGYGDGTLAGSGVLIGSIFTPTAFTGPNLFRWYSINLVADTTNADGTMNVKPLILAGTDGASSATAIKAPFSSKKLGQVLVEAPGTGSTINNIPQTSVIQLLAGSGSGGGGAAPKMIGGGIFAWDLGTTSLSFTADINIEQPRLNYADNTILAATSPLVLTTTNHVAYIDRLNASSGGPNLTVLVDLITNVKDGQIIIARRDGNDVIVGSSSERLRSGQSTELYAQESIQSRNTLRSTDFLRSDIPVTWTGSLLEFTADIILESHNTRTGTTKLSTVLLAGSPVTLTNGDIGYVVIDRSTGSSNVSVVVAAAVPTITSESQEVVILFKRIDVSGASYLHIPLHKQVIEPGQTFRLGSTGSSASANEYLESFKNVLVDSTFSLVTPYIASVSTDTLLDGSSTATYSLADKTINFGVTPKILVTKQLADPLESLNNTNALSSVDLHTYWNSGFIDPLAVYEVSRNGGNEWQTVTMERVGNTNLWQGSRAFTQEAVNQSIVSLASVTDSFELNATTQKQIAQAFTLATKTLVKTVTLELNRSATVPDGNFYVQIITDSAGSPSTAADAVLSESAAIPMSSLSSGNQSLIVNIPNIYLIAGTYHIGIRTDAAYQATFVTSTKRLAWRGDATASTPYIRVYDTSWLASGGNQVAYSINGLEVDLRVKITSGTSNVKLDALGVFYEQEPSGISTGIKNREVFNFSGDLDTFAFALTSFIPEPDLLRVYDINTGQVYAYGAFSLDGQTVTFTAGQFLMPGENVTLVFDQTTGGSFDNSDLNALLLANNHLGSTDGVSDKSIAGRGIFLRRPDGTLREIAIDDSDNIVIYSV